MLAANGKMCGTCFWRIGFAVEVAAAAMAMMATLLLALCKICLCVACRLLLRIGTMCLSDDHLSVCPSVCLSV